MKKLVLLLAVVLLALVGFVIVGPFWTMHQIKQGIERDDPELLSENIDFPALRQNLKEQFSAQMMKKSAAELQNNPFGVLGAALASNLVDGLVDSFVTPAALAMLMEGKKPGDMTGIRGTEPTDLPGPHEATVPAPHGFVNDFAHVLDRGTVDALTRLIGQLQQKTGAEIAVVTVDSTAPLSAFDYAMKIAESWKPGAKGKDNGVVFLVAVKDRQMYILTGSGAVRALPDARVGEIRDRLIRPRLGQGDYAGGIRAATEEMAAALAAEYGVTVEVVQPVQQPSREHAELFKGASYSFDSASKFSIRVPGEQGQEIRFVLTRDGLAWKLTNIVILMQARS
ncbi:MAG: TPM domain-containing protein [Candidatus Binatia bacterium]|jgi:uncharacterized protein YneF (UPF0154 family)